MRAILSALLLTRKQYANSVGKQREKRNLTDEGFTHKAFWWFCTTRKMWNG